MAKIGIIFWSGAGNTERMAELIGQGASDSGAEVVCKRVDVSTPADVEVSDIVVFGSPAMGAELVEQSEMAPFVKSVLQSLGGKKVALFGSFGWGDGEWMRLWAAELRASGARLIDDGLTINEAPDGEKADICLAYGRRIATS